MWILNILFVLYWHMSSPNAELLKDYKSPEGLLGKNGMVKQLQKALHISVHHWQCGACLVLVDTSQVIPSDSSDIPHGH